MMEIVADQRIPVPKPLWRIALGAMKRSVRKRAQFDLDKVRCLLPAVTACCAALGCQLLWFRALRFLEHHETWRTGAQRRMDVRPAGSEGATCLK